ncbi:serine hydrolase [Rhodanobacter sp. AS-Z3]|uniref:serine hydrolase domain-containing protein n=1 Tax=Rhodanobacter sp. AS-Z3 TaxID=3031330 RepID=UPI00247A3121|nr:serine hydrolase [Rhodanobacter sp. AS-Z3]WEN14015.1 serine hydrolase [Rhodanobacter sp. AS-Z3]
MSIRFKKSLRVGFGATLLLVVLLAALVVWKRPDRALRVATASVAQTLCAYVFVSGQTPERAFAENILPQRGMHILLRGLHYRVDAERREVTVNWHGHFSGEATWYPAYGCGLPTTRPDAAALQAADEVMSETSIAEPPVAANTDPALEAALSRAFAEPASGPRRHVHAIVVVHDGKIIAELYAAGFTAQTPQLGYSMSKSVINALLGILVRQGRLDMAMPAPVAAWQRRDDPRHPITLEQLSRMTSGLDLTEDDSGFDPVSEMLFQRRDMAAFAASAGLRTAPGSQWAYTSGNTLILAGVLRDHVAGGAAGMIRFAHRELFGPLGMHHVRMEFDGAQTLVGSTRIYASARDWARLGQLYLDDGVVAGQRILPAGWSAAASRQTLDSLYGFGFWTNTGVSTDGGHIIAGMPGDAYFASGMNGQRILIVPSQRLVIVRLGSTIDPPNFDMRGLVHLVNDVTATLR